VTAASRRYGYVGLGEMGGAMCRHLLRSGGDVIAFDPAAAAMTRAIEAGADGATSAADVARASDVVSICVPAADHVEAVMSGPDGIEGGAHDGLTVLIHSTVHPDTMRAARDLAAPWGVAVHDANVAGGETAADDGTLVVFVGELGSLPPRAREVIEIYGDHIIDAGPVGSGAAIKIGVNVMTYAQQAAATAAYELVDHQGASTDALLEAWRHNGQAGPIIERFIPMAAMSRDDVAGMADYLANVVAIEQKDLDLALALGDGTDRGPSPVVAAIRDHLPTVFRID